MFSKGKQLLVAVEHGDKLNRKQPCNYKTNHHNCCGCKNGALGSTLDPVIFLCSEVVADDRLYSLVKTDNWHEEKCLYAVYNSHAGYSNVSTIGINCFV